MTIISPKKNKSFIARLTLLFSIPIIGGVVLLIMLYNGTVNAAHATAAQREELHALHEETAALKDKLFAFFDRDELERFARERNLVKETKPHYLKIGDQWEFASQF